MNSPLHLLCQAALTGCLLLTPLHAADSKPLVVPPEEAGQYVGKDVAVTMPVKSSKNAAKRKMIFLDSETDFRDPKNLGIIIDEDAQARFSQAGIAEPHVHFKGKTIRITGTVIKWEDRVYIRADDPSQITLIEK